MTGWCWVVVALLLHGCTRANPAATCGDGTCIDPAFPYCDKFGLIGGIPGGCVAVSCAEGEVGACHDEKALTCNAAGNGYDEVDCAAGCADEPKPHCKYLQPRYVPDVCDVRATGDLTFASSGTFDPNLDVNCNGGILAQSSAPDLCVVHYATFSIAAGSELRVLGLQTTLGRAIAFVADDDVQIEGTLDVGAHGNTNGPGGGLFESGGPMFPNDGTGAGGQGGGGAGGRTAGAPGATDLNDAAAANGGVASPDPTLFAVLLGGASTARGTYTIGGAPLIGGGGGGVTLISCHSTVNVAGMIQAGGGGGLGGHGAVEGVYGGVGGGAGGFVVLQGIDVRVTGELFSNGGGGGAGKPSTGGAGAAGNDGARSDANGGAGGVHQFTEGDGGGGGFGTNAPAGGKKPSNTIAGGGGGGGGSTGFLQTFTPQTSTPVITPTHVSPAFSPNGIAQTR